MARELNKKRETGLKFSELQEKTLLNIFCFRPEMFFSHSMIYFLGLSLWCKKLLLILYFEIFSLWEAFFWKTSFTEIDHLEKFVTFQSFQRRQHTIVGTKKNSTKKNCRNTKSVSVVQFFKLFWILVAVMLRESTILNNLSSKFIVVF